MKIHRGEKQTLAKLPIQIRYRAQDYETRYLDDPRALYIDEFNAKHADDGFFAIIPSETAAEKSQEGKWMTVVWVALAFASLSWIAYRLLSHL